MTTPVASRPAILYIECTPTVRFDHGTGIPRVVRNVVQHAIRIGRDRGIEVRPIAFTNGAFFAARLSAEGSLVTLMAENVMQPSWRMRVKERYRAVINGTGRIFPPGRARQWWVAPGADPGLTRTLRRILRRKISADAEPPLALVLAPDAVAFQPGDTVLAAEPFLDRAYLTAFLALRGKGIRLACIAYDLIPIRHPEYVSVNFLAAFRNWVDRLVAGSDLVVAISEVIRDDVTTYLADLGNAARPVDQRVTWFHLGHDLERASAEGTVRRRIVRIFDRHDAGPVFLMVGWLDPRKNQGFVLDSMATLRQAGIPFRLLVIGKRGRGTDAYYSRLRADPELARSVHTFHDATDTELAYCYSHSAGLIYPSTTEGFGLPLVEALAHGTRVFASDIPIFREIGQGFVSFFPLDDPQVLTDKLHRFCVAGEFDAPREIAEFHWPTWRESVERLLDVMLEPQTEEQSA